MRRAADIVLATLLVTTSAAAAGQTPARPETLGQAARDAQQELRQTFSNLQFEDFGPAPVKGPLYQANAGGRIIYYAPESGHLLFAAIYDRSGVNVTALAQDALAARKLKAIDRTQALAMGPETAPQVIEFTDPDCPYCRSLDRYWAAKAAEGKPVRRLIYFVSGIHATAAAKAEHIMCSADREAAFKSIYAGAAPAALKSCPSGKAKVAAHASIVQAMGLSGTPTLVVDGRMIAGFQQAELDAFLNEPGKPVDVRR